MHSDSGAGGGVAAHSLMQVPHFLMSHCCLREIAVLYQCHSLEEMILDQTNPTDIAVQLTSAIGVMR